MKTSSQRIRGWVVRAGALLAFGAVLNLVVAAACSVWAHAGSGDRTTLQKTPSRITSETPSDWPAESTTGLWRTYHHLSGHRGFAGDVWQLSLITGNITGGEGPSERSTVLLLRPAGLSARW